MVIISCFEVACTEYKKAGKQLSPHIISCYVDVAITCVYLYSFKDQHFKIMWSLLVNFCKINKLVGNLVVGSVKVLFCLFTQICGESVSCFGDFYLIFSLHFHHFWLRCFAILDKIIMCSNLDAVDLSYNAMGKL